MKPLDTGGDWYFYFWIYCFIGGGENIKEAFKWARRKFPLNFYEKEENFPFSCSSPGWNCEGNKAVRIFFLLHLRCSVCSWTSFFPRFQWKLNETFRLLFSAGVHRKKKYPSNMLSLALFFMYWYFLCCLIGRTFAFLGDHLMSYFPLLLLLLKIPEKPMKVQIKTLYSTVGLSRRAREVSRHDKNIR